MYNICMQLHTYIVKTRVFVVNNGTCLLVTVII